MTGIHDLLDAVSSGQPQAAVSVDDLVRRGRRHQRAVASGVAAATAGIAAVLGVALTVHGGHRVPATPSASSAAPINLATTAIAAAHVFSGGTSVGTWVETMACGEDPRLTVVSQDAQHVVVSLTIPGLGAPGKGTWLRTGATTPATCGLFPSTGTAAEFHGPTFDREVVAEIPYTLGDRTLIDASTGRTIPYTGDNQAAEPDWLPPRWQDVTGVHPTDLYTWEQTYQLADRSEQLDLTQRYQADAQLPGPANAMVATHPARLDSAADTLTLTWFWQGRLYTLSDFPVVLCNSPGPTGNVVCPTPAATTPRALTKAELLRIARSVTPR